MEKEGERSKGRESRMEKALERGRVRIREIRR